MLRGYLADVRQKTILGIVYINRKNKILLFGIQSEIVKVGLDGMFQKEQF